ncbi:MAG: glycosyltransferase family 1 protein [Sphingopyxis sp.]|nr:glycosyltransferase family 1 protein [Sphingopyxis sp.]
MIRRGHEVHVSSPDLKDAFADHFRAMGAIPHNIELKRTKISFTGDILYYRSIVRLVRKAGIDFVLNYTIKPNIWGSLAAKQAGARSASMVTGLGFAFIERRGVMRKLTQKVAQGLYRLATDANSHVIFQNPDDRDDFIAAGCLADRTKVIMVNGSGINLDQFVPVPLPEQPVFLTIARLLHSKGLYELAEASRAVRQALPGARILIAGMFDSGPDAVTRAELDRWVADGIEYLGLLDDVRPALANSSVFVLPSWREGTPRTVLEAMAMGRPIITTDAPGCRETTVDGINGRLVPVKDAGTLAEAMIDLGTDDAKRARMGAVSRKVAEDKYDVHRVNASMLDLLGL